MGGLRIDIPKPYPDTPSEARRTTTAREARTDDACPSLSAPEEALSTDLTWVGARRSRRFVTAVDRQAPSVAEGGVPVYNGCAPSYSVCVRGTTRQHELRRRR